MNARLSLLLMIITSCGTAYGNAADPPGRVARVSYLIGETFFQTGGTQALEPAVLNWPMTSGDRLSTGRDARAEASLGIATVRLDEETDLTLLELDRNVAQVEIESGTVSIHLRELQRGEAFSVKMRRSKMQLLKPGDYRITVLSDGRANILVREGESIVDTGAVSFQQLAGEEAQVGIDRTVAIGRSKESDEFDRWSLRRQRQFSGQRAAQHIARGLVGYEDLDAYGAWHWEPDYGMVWEPERVGAEWAPYRFGQWIWKEPWGWTWVDEAPWGFAPFHYGRWVHLRSRWYWLPGPRQIPPVYAPALVAWAEDSADRSIIGWYPLGPRERYAPSYRASEQHVRHLNIFSNARTYDAFPAEGSREDRNTSPAITWTSRLAFADRPPLERFASDRRARRVPKQFLTR